MANPYPPPPRWAADIASIGVTGTNGKSSTTRFVWAGLCADPRCEGPVARVTTVDMAIGDELGEPPEDHAAFLGAMQRLHARGGRCAAIEATSATLALGFARAWPFRVGVFTNLGLDHMRTHGSVEHYLASKAQLFVNLEPGATAVLNADDANASLIAEVVPPGVRVVWFAGPGAYGRELDLQVRAATPSREGLELELAAAPWLAGVPERLQLRVLPSFQALNVAAAVLACAALGVPPAAAASAIAGCEAPRGRFEVIETGRDHPTVIIDYAHTPEALSAALADARALTGGRVVLVFGAGGGTDAGKRAPLGRAATAADLVWLTSDNPRDEDPRSIIEDLRVGLADANTEIHIELDRGRAIAQAIAAAECDDLVLIAGKGHERLQQLAGTVVRVSDHELVRAAIGPRDQA